MKTSIKTPMSDAIGKTVVFLGVNYIYTGILIEEHPTHVVVDDCSIVYETGGWSKVENKIDWKFVEKFPKRLQPWRISKAAFESWGVDTKPEGSV
jgi:hypothetical protein